MAVSSGFGATELDKMRWRAEDTERELKKYKNDFSKAKVVFIKDRGVPLEELGLEQLKRFRNEIKYQPVLYLLDPDILPEIEFLISKKEQPYMG